MSRFQRIPQIVSIFVMLAAWFAASNHCALLAMGRETPAVKMTEIHKCCPAKTAGGGEQMPVEKRPGQCCHGLQVLPADASAKLVTAPDAVVLFQLVWSCVAASEVEAEATEIREACGPPEARSFAEVVLQRSLLSHAPPFAV